jgi:Na+/melibiose symporter-like transporter
MSAAPRVSALAPFEVRSYRFQWPADLATSWAFEMEALILGWYVLVETGSVLLLTLFASLQYTGTLLAPMFGVVGHRIGTKKLICGMRATYAALATTLMTLAFTGILSPVYVFIVAALMGLVRPSDLVMRYALIGETMPATRLLGATSVSRTTQDSARIAGALTGAGLVAALGIGPAYVAIASLYATSLLLTLNVAGRGPASRAGAAAEVSAAPRARSSAWRDLRDGVARVWTTPQLLAAMILAFLVNVTAFPLVNALLPYVAKELYRTDQTVLGYLLASWAFGALLGSITLSRFGHAIRPARTMLVGCALWYIMIVVFAQMDGPAGGAVALMLAGFAQSFGMISMSAMLLRTAGDEFRSRVMGIRMLAVYGLPVGLLLSGPLIKNFGYPATAMFYCAIGLAFTLFIAVRWREHIWRRDAPANLR